MDELNTKITQFQTALQEFYTSTGIEVLMKGIVDLGTILVNYFNTLPKLFGKIPTGAITMIANLVTTIKPLITKALDWIEEKIIERAKRIKDETDKVAKEAGESNKKNYDEGQKNAENGNTSGNTNETIGTNSSSSSLSGFGSNKKLGSMITGISTVATTAISSALSTNHHTTASKLVSTGGSLANAIGSYFSGNWAGLIANAWSTISGGIDAIANRAEDRLKDLEAIAEESKNEALLKKDEYDTLQNYVDQYEELEEAQYDSAEAAQEFTDLQNEIAEKYPELIKSFDAQGNAIVVLQEAEEELTRAREKSTKATYEAH